MSNGISGNISTIGVQDEKVRKCLTALIDACNNLAKKNDELRIRIEKIERNGK